MISITIKAIGFYEFAIMIISFSFMVIIAYQSRDLPMKSQYQTLELELILLTVLFTSIGILMLLE